MALHIRTLDARNMLALARALQRVPHAYSEKIRRVLRMALEPRPQSRATADDIWAVLASGGK